MNYQNGWTWHANATEQQMESAHNKALCDRLAQEARNLYNEIPEVRRRGYDDDCDYSAEDARAEDTADRVTTELEDSLTSEQLEQVICRAFDDLKQQDADKRAAQFGRLEAIEQLLHLAGGRFCRPYEHWNEDERAMEYAERDRDNE